MSVSIHHPIGRLFFWTLTIIFFLLIQTLAQAAQVTLAWDPNDPAPDGYRVYQRAEGQNFDYTSPVWPSTGDDPTQTTCTLDNLADSSSYYFVVRAYVGSDESGDSNEVNYLTGPSDTSTYTISTSTGANGVISPTSATVNAGDSQAFTITPNAGYHVEDVLVDGVSVGAVTTYTLTGVDADHTISASFAAIDFTIQASSGSGGAISPSGAVNVSFGGGHTFTTTPDAGYQVENVLVDGVPVGAVTSYTFSGVNANHTISASFTATDFTIQASSGSGGTLSPTGTVSVGQGGSHTFTITPDTGYSVEDVVVDGASVGPVSSYTFEQVAGDHAIHAVFIADTVTIAASAGLNGTITPSGSVNVSIGDSQTFSIYPDSGYTTSDVVVDGISMGSLDTYIFSNATGNHTIDAVFTVENQSPVADAGPDQNADEGQIVTLSGINSIDEDDGIATFQWRQIQGAQVALSAPGQPETTFTAPNVDSSGTALVFELSVTDYSGATTVDSCIVNVTWVNEPPIANAGADQTVAEGAQVLLDASHSTDSDDGIASCTWIQTSGPVVALSNGHSATPTFVAPDVGSTGTSLTFEVTVTDAGGLQDTNTCLVNVTWVNTPPVADAGVDQSAAIGDEVILDGSNSYDADDLQSTSYRWHQTNGVPVELSDPTAARPMFFVPEGSDGGIPLTFELTVTDSGGLQAVDSCHVNVQSTGPALHIAGIRMELKQKGPNVEANAFVTIVDDAGTVVKEATVSGNWTCNGNPLNTATTTSRGDGIARLYSEKVRITPGAVFAIEITGIAKSGYAYDPTSNTVTGDSLMVP